MTGDETSALAEDGAGAWLRPTKERAARARPPGKRHALPHLKPSHRRTRPSPAAPPRGTGRAAGGRREMRAQLSRERQAAPGPSPRTSVRGPSVVAAPVRGRPCKADGPSRRSQSSIPVRYASVDTAI